MVTLFVDVPCLSGLLSVFLGILMLSLTFWANIPSHPHLDLCSALAATPEVDLRIVFAHHVPPERTVLGWDQDALESRFAALGARFLDGRSPLQALRIITHEWDRLHCFHGIWVHPALTVALIWQRLRRRRLVIYSEASNPYLSRSSFKAVLKGLLGHWIGHWQGASLLAASRLASTFYRPFGFEGDRVLPFGYYRAAPSPDLLKISPQPGASFVYVGQFVPRKGVDLLLDAVRPLFDQYPDLGLTLYGGGTHEAALRQQVAGLARVHFGGVLRDSEVQSRIAGAAALILPSRWDGWGLIVNEALAVGVPCLVSDQCGSAEVISPGIDGDVFPAGNAAGLRDCLERHLQRRDQWPQMRLEAQKKGAALAADQAAARLVKWLQALYP